MRTLLRFVPAAIAALALGAVLLRVDIDELRTAMVQGHVTAIVPWAALLAIGYMALHANWERLLLSRTPVPPRYSSVWAGKAGTAVLNAVGFALGSGGYVIWIARATGVGVGGALALRTIAIIADLAALALVTLVAILIGQATVPTAFSLGVVGAFGAAAAVAAGLRLALVPRRVVPVVHLRNFVATAAAVPLTTWSTQVLGRALSMCLSIAATSAAAIAFGLDIPIAILCALVPVSMLVRVLPANVAGFGAAQAAFVAVFSSYESEARLFAFHVLWQLAANVCYVLRGLPFVNRATLAIVNAPSAAHELPQLSSRSSQ
jgi:hypothetical protein